MVEPKALDRRRHRPGDRAGPTVDRELLPLLPDRDRALKQAKIPDAPQEPGARNNIVPPLERAPRRVPPRGRRSHRVGPAAPAGTGAGQPGKPAELPPVALRPIEGAPGDGAESSNKALLHFLGIANVPVVSEYDNPFAVVAGAVALSSVSPRVQNVKIEWVLRGLSGCQMGTVSQANQIPAGAGQGLGRRRLRRGRGRGPGADRDLLAQLEKMPEGQRCKR